MARLNQLSKHTLFLFTALILTASSAVAGDGATILFREGQVAYINNGYAQLVDNYKQLNRSNSEHNIIELKIESSPFLINLAEVVLICRDRCTSVELMDPRRSSPTKSNVTVNSRQ